MFEKKKENNQQDSAEPEGKKPEEQKITVEEIIADNKELVETLQRLQADFENFKKREEKNREDFSKFCSASIFFDFLDFMDSFESALLKCSPEQKDALEPLYYQLKKFLEKNGVKQFSALNERFDPELHEVLLTGYKPDKDENVVLEELKKGYYLHEKVLRHAQVKVNQKPVKKIAAIRDELKEQLSKLSGTEDSAERKMQEQKRKDEITAKLFSQESAEETVEQEQPEKSKAVDDENIV